MALYVQKYGGTSVGSLERIAAVAERVKLTRAQGHDVVVVVSAMSGETNRLLGMAQQLDPDATRREVDVLISTGEQVTIALLAIALNQCGCPAVSMTGDQVRIHTDSAHGKARITHIDTEPVRAQLAAGKVVVIAGFQGRDEHNAITTLGRGGSDTTAVAVAAAIGADECQIFTDVDGVYTTDPRIEPKARRLSTITFEEMLEMASLGAKVLQIRSVEFAGKYRVPLRVLSSFADGEGTLITYGGERMEAPLVSGIAFNRNEASLTILGVPDRPTVAAQILGPISDANIDVDMIVQNTLGDGSADFTFTVNRDDFRRARALLESTATELGASCVQGNESIAKVSIVGVGMWNHPGVARTMFRVLGEHGINMQLISTSEIKISVVVDEKYLELAVRSLHDAFALDREPQEQPMGG
ncbi:aspartate kinase [Aeromonas simiae]|uniref:Aspartokinase n=1 Tax=Aeromonas simiae TaxID=218936 RepID=A0A5J6X261_9GAMM|nr:aspartate kinase [Aeromonas simiae]MDO2949117.1 aspartate kinase [Aeromonas simiae]MDO2953839.1 aspartate kinase [Aeromonas simiae]MDO2956288.1 aspartate kinase [Aeromonas simiae]QFI55815.1 aspartate kinase [Aeromonas simiae]